MVNTLDITHVVQVLLPSAEALQAYEQHPAHIAALTPAMPRVQQVIAVDVEMPGLDVDAFLRLQHAPHVHHLTLIRPNAGVNRAQLSTTMQQWGALPIVVPQLVWASVGFAADKPLYDGWRDMTQGYSVVSDVMGRDLQSMAGYTQSGPHMQLAPAVVGITNIQRVASSPSLAAAISGRGGMRSELTR